MARAVCLAAVAASLLAATDAIECYTYKMSNDPRDMNPKLVNCTSARSMCMQYSGTQSGATSMIAHELGGCTEDVNVCPKTKTGLEAQGSLGHWTCGTCKTSECNPPTVVLNNLPPTKPAPPPCEPPYCWNTNKMQPASCETWSMPPVYIWGSEAAHPLNPLVSNGTHNITLAVDLHDRNNSIVDQLMKQGVYKMNQKATTCKDAMMCQTVMTMTDTGTNMGMRLMMSSACDMAFACTGNMPTSQYSVRYHSQEGDMVKGYNDDGNRIMGSNWDQPGCRWYTNTGELPKYYGERWWSKGLEGSWNTLIYCDKKPINGTIPNITFNWQTYGSSTSEYTAESFCPKFTAPTSVAADFESSEIAITTVLVVILVVFALLGMCLLGSARLMMTKRSNTLENIKDAMFNRHDRL